MPPSKMSNIQLYFLTISEKQLKSGYRFTLQADVGWPAHLSLNGHRQPAPLLVIFLKNLAISENSIDIEKGFVLCSVYQVMLNY